MSNHMDLDRNNTSNHSNSLHETSVDSDDSNMKIYSKTTHTEQLEKVDETVTNAEESEEDDDENIFNPYLFIAQLPTHASVVIPNKLCLPPIHESFQQKKTLVLDLDETLVHCTVEPIENPDLIFPVS